MTAVRLLLGATGVGLVVVGLVLLSDDRLADLVGVAVWLAGGVLAHDALLAPLVVVIGALVVLRLPSSARRPAIVGLVVLMSVTLVAVPVLGRFGAKPDDPGLLDRPYLTLWLVLVGLVVAGVALAALAAWVTGAARHREEE